METRALYKRTGNIWMSAVLNALLMTTMTLANTMVTAKLSTATDTISMKRATGPGPNATTEKAIWSPPGGKRKNHACKTSQRLSGQGTLRRTVLI